MAGRGGTSNERNRVRSDTLGRRTQPSGRVATRTPMGRPTAPSREQLPVPQTGSGGSGQPPANSRSTAVAAPDPGNRTPTTPGRNLTLRNSLPELRLPPSSRPTAPRGPGVIGAGLTVAGALAPLAIDYFFGGDGGRAEAARLAETGRVARNEQAFISADRNVPSMGPEANLPATPQRAPARRPAAPREELSADRLNDLSLALARGQEPNPRNAAEALAVQRMRVNMRGNEMATGGAAMPRMPKPRASKAPKASMPRANKPRLPGAPRMSKGGATKKGKK